MNYRASGKIQNAHCFQPAALSPYPVRQGIIYQSSPEQAEQQKALKLHTLHKRSGDQRRCDDCEHHLKGSEKSMGYGFAVIIVGQSADTVKPRKIQTSD